MQDLATQFLQRVKQEETSLASVIRPVESHLVDFHIYFRNSIRSNIALLDLVVRYIVRQRGKRVRPALVFLCSQLCGEINDRTYIGASMVELLHTATLVHDDVVDEAAERRGVASINAVWKNKIAVLVGDFFLSRGLLMAVNHEEFDFLRITSNAVKRLSEGELLQIQKSRQRNMDEDTYFRIISDKTGSLLSTCCEIGAVSASASDEERLLLREYGELVGLAFQIRDDVLDYTSRTSILGKPVGNDLREKKVTLPLIYACSQAPDSESKRVIKLVKSGKMTNKDIDYVQEFVRKWGGIESAMSAARGKSQHAMKLLSNFPDSPARNSLLGFAEFAVTRKS